MGLFDFFDHAQAVLDKVSAAKEVRETAKQLAQTKRLRQAVKEIDSLVADWDNPSFWEKQAQQFLLRDVLEEVSLLAQGWKRTIAQADRFADEAKALEASDKGNPFETELLSKALNSYQQGNRLIYDARFLEGAKRCEEEIQKRQGFQEYVAQARETSKQGFFKRGLHLFLEAKKLFSSNNLDRAIATCQSRVKQEEDYEGRLHQARQQAKAGGFTQAFLEFKPIFTKFPRSDGKEFLTEVHRVIQAKERFKAGLLAEQRGDIVGAELRYREAIKSLPELTEGHIRLAVVALKQNQWNQAVEQLEGITGEEASYLRGFAHAKAGNLKQADREWQSISDSNIQSQREILKTWVKRDRLEAKKAIEEFVNQDNLEAAEAATQEFTQKFGVDGTVETNLAEHIQPRLKIAVWESQNWQDIVEFSEKDWLQQQDILALHNLAVASYYQAQIDSNRLADWIGTWATALANLPLDPCLQDVPWLHQENLDLSEVFQKLKQLLEQSIDAVKDSNLAEYLTLRDLYRTEILALRFMGDSPSCGLKLDSVSISPGFYQRYRSLLPEIMLPAQIWGTLYSNWGEVIAACLEGDTSRAIQIKPTASPVTEVERFAEKVFYYHAGCYYLQNQQWQEAVSPLKKAKAEIKSSPEWQQEIDKLGNVQRKAITQLEEHLNFAQFWYDLWGSNTASCYLAEYKAEEVRAELVEEKITSSKALTKLNEIKKIDSNNPIVIDLIERIEIAIDVEEVQDLMQRDRFEDAVDRAKRSRHQRVRYIMAKICLEILINGAESNQLSAALLRQLGRWAYELCPNEPEFKGIYQQLGIR